ncbi:alpha/beta hydrolase [Phytomonospora sp. NPDC050363]|uniref:alpha/beta hydrolase n=1 Tax=Phytomonospora sp. NPDC050363 TaxID=3155642 RepID=UPI0033E9EC36
MVTFAQLQAANSQPFRDAAKAYGDLADKLIDRSDAGVKQLNKVPDAWDGAGTGAALTAIKSVCVEVDDAVLMLQRCDQILADFAGELDKAKALLGEAIGQARAIPAAVGPDGTLTVSPKDGPPAGHPAWAGIQKSMVDAAKAISDAVQYAVTADITASSSLVALVPGTKGSAYPVDQIPPRGTDPAKVKTWWDSLTPEQRQWLIATQPGLVGWLDGVPAASRDQANRLTLSREQKRVKDRLELLKSQGQEGGDEYKDLQGKLKGLDAIEKRLQAGNGDGQAADGVQGNGQRAYLLGVDTSGDGKAIVAIGNPDTADNIVTYVPGTGADLSKVGGDMNRVDRMVFDANQMDPSERTAGILWLGYDAPDDIIQFPPGGDATDPKYAKGAGADLDLFQDGLRATNEGGRSTNSVIGHSYGSTVVGYTARDHGLDIDNAIFVGSPGVGVERAADLGLNPDNVYSSHAKNDPIQYALDPGDLARNLVIPSPDQDLIHGHNPSRADFGGHRFQSDAGTPLMDPQVKTKTYDPFGRFGPSVTVPTGVDLNLSGEAHSQYWDDGNESRTNVAKIVTGNGDTVTGDH